MPIEHPSFPSNEHRALDGRQTAGRKGVPYDWQAVIAEAMVAEVESSLRDEASPSGRSLR